jgi:hypothetical protein
LRKKKKKEVSNERIVIDLDKDEDALQIDANVTLQQLNPITDLFNKSDLQRLINPNQSVQPEL